MPERAQLLAKLIDEDVLAALRRKVTPDQIADLILQILTPPPKLTSEEEAKLEGISASGIRKRRARAR